ncbi:TIR domain-containing adapter molecule 1-like [Pelobates fuscus]|uniref:TIR domain-containing adapter molecule 1-like n=1 Tax=Pelobates fuscus TaxID=191477 RepID=UPI002FE4D3A3
MFQSHDSNSPKALRSIPIPISRQSSQFMSNPLEISQTPTMPFNLDQRNQGSDSKEIVTAHPEKSLPWSSSASDVVSTSQIESSVPVHCGIETAKCDADVNKNSSKECKQPSKPFPRMETEVTGSHHTASEKKTTFDTTSCTTANEKQSQPTCSVLLSSSSECTAFNHGAAEDVPIPPLSAPMSDPQFFSFVILHAPDDVENASRVCNILRQLGAGEGTTFYEHFEIPGQNPINSMEEAIENCAYIILLFTKCFENQWTKFQSNTALMNSINDPRKFGTVIPFLPKEDRLDRHKIPLCLRTLTALDEMLPAFKMKVRKSFPQHKVQEQETLWKTRQMMQQLKIEPSNSNSVPSNHNPHRAYHPMPAMPPLAQQPLQGSAICLNFPQQSMSETMFSPITGNGQTPIIQINNAGNVQIGNNNNMSVQEIPGAFYGENNQDYHECTQREENFNNVEGENIESENRNAFN